MHPLAQRIAALQRRLILRERATAAMRISAAVMATALVLGGLDYALRFNDPGMRILVTATLLAVIVAAVYRWWYLPSRDPLTPLAVARQVESRFPKLHDSLASAFEFLQQSEHDRTAGSAQLRRVVIAETETAVQHLPLEAVIEHRPLRRAAMWLTALTIGVALAFTIDARAVTTALARLAAPLGSTDWPRQHYLAFRHVPKRLAAGETFEVELVNTAGELPDDVRIEYRTTRNGGRKTTSERMVRAGDVLLARRENVRHAFAFRATGGDDDTMRWRWVEVVEPPRTESLTLTVHPPKYTGLPATPTGRHLHVLAGSGIEMHGTTNKPLGMARVHIDDFPPIMAKIQPDTKSGAGEAFYIGPDEWIATKSASYRLELAAKGEPAAVVGRWNLRVEADPPPSASWQYPTDDLHVTREAVVPIQLLVKDNLAIRNVRLIYERSDRSEAERDRAPTEPAIDVYRGPETAQSRSASRGDGENRLIDYAWDLAPLGLPVGAELTVHAEAIDYRPGIGRTSAPRRISIITPDELEARLAARQEQIVRQLERALAIEQSTRESVRRLEIQQRDAGTIRDDSRHTLQSAELNQRRVAHTLVDPRDGVPALIGSLLAELEMNRTVSSSMAEPLDQLKRELDRLRSGPLSIAERELTTARKATEVADASQNISQTLAAAGAAQEGVIDVLERLVREFSGKADYRRFARLITELREDQIAHERATRAEVGVETLPLRANELSRAQRASLNTASAGQAALTRRFQKIEQEMDRAARELLEEQSAEAPPIAEAVRLARRLAIAAQMQETARDFSDNRVGQALARERQIAADLQQVLDLLRGDSERHPERLAEQLRSAEQRLARLREELATLREQIAQAEQRPAPNQRQLNDLMQGQQSLQRETGELARQLERLQAREAGKSVRNAEHRLASRNQKQQAADHPSPSQDVQQAEQDLERAAQQLAASRQEAEDDLALQFVRRFQAELAEMVQRQERVVEQTLDLDRQQKVTSRERNDDIRSAAELAAEERGLAQMAREHSELLFGLGAVRISLEEAERRLTAAAELLEQNDTGIATQRAEQHALTRLQAMMEAFEQTAAEAGQYQAAQPNAENADQADQPQRRPTFELLEVKMLRMLQADLHERTQEFQRRQAALSELPATSQQAELAREARGLADEQAQLAELVQSMLIRDNEDNRP